MLLAWWLNKRRVRESSGRTFSARGALSWIGFYRGGLHPALALVPIIPFFPHAARDPGLFVEAPNAHDTLNEFEHRFKRPVDVMLFFFGLANAGVAIGNAGAGTWFVLVAIIVGKPLGILAATGICRRSGTAPAKGRRLERPDRRRHHRGIGFTVALFFATAAFPYGRLLDETKLGALLSFGAFFLGLAAARVLKVGRSASK